MYVEVASEFILYDMNATSYNIDDIGLLKLNNSIKYSDTAKPICLSNFNSNDYEHFVVTGTLFAFK